MFVVVAVVVDRVVVSMVQLAVDSFAVVVGNTGVVVEVVVGWVVGRAEVVVAVVAAVVVAPLSSRVCSHG